MITPMDTEDRTHDDAELSSELDGFLEAAARSDSWRVERTLKSSPFETTELVRFRGASGGELGPFIRKRIDCSAARTSGSGTPSAQASSCTAFRAWSSASARATSCRS